MLLEVGVALAPAAWLHLVVAVQVVECGLGDVDAPAGGEGSGRGGGNLNSELQPLCRTQLQPHGHGSKSGSKADPNLDPHLDILCPSNAIKCLRWGPPNRTVSRL